MPTKNRTGRPARRRNRSATGRLARLVTEALRRQELTREEIAREAKLPATAFRSLLRHGHRPSLDRADEICQALGISMTIGVATPTNRKKPANRSTQS